MIALHEYNKRAQRARRGEEGYALLAVLGILTILAIIATAFAVELRFEEQAAVNYVRAGSARGVTEAGSLAGIAALIADSRGLDNVSFTGDEQTDVDSDFESWRVGYQRQISPGLVYDLRRYSPAPIPNLFPLNPPFQYRYVLDDLDALGRPRFRMGVDEDPVGDLSALLLGEPPAPGFAGVDDDLDGLTDEDSMGRQPGEPGYTNDLANDDDEDGLIDEDSPDIVYDSLALPYELLIDRDDDATGIFDEAAKVNINYAGNLSFLGGQGISSGYSKSEVDLSMLIFVIMRHAGWTAGDAQGLARDIVEYRYGAGRPGVTNAKPGLGGVDDDGNSDPATNPPNNQLDDNQNSLIDDVEEIYIGPTFVSPGNRITEYYPGDRVDNDGDGLTDEDFNVDLDGLREGVDEPGEFRVDPPFGDDNPFNTLDEARFVRRMDEIVTLPDGQDNNNDGQTDEPGEDDFTVFQLLEPFLTVHSSALDKSPHFGDQLFRLRINTLNNYTSPMIDSDDVHRRRVPEDLFGLAFDDDGDWRQFPVKDPSGNIIELSDDVNGNGHPDGNWSWEADDPFSLLAGVDSDHDRWVLTDNGDHDNDGNVASDPEPRVNEDDIGNAFAILNNGYGNGEPGIIDDPFRDGDDDGDGEADFDDEEVNFAIDATLRQAPSIPNPNPVADPENGFDGIDNDGDGYTDEIGETYCSFPDDDEDGAYDEDPSEISFLLRVFDWLDQIGPEVDSSGDTWFTDPVIRRLMPLQVRRYPAQAFDPNLVNKTSGNQFLDGDPSRNFYVNDPNDVPPIDRQTYIQLEGCEAIRINEVMVEPYIRLEAEDYDDFQILSGAVDNASAPLCTTPGNLMDTSWRLNNSGGFFEVFEDARLCTAGFRPPNQAESARFVFRNLPPNARFNAMLFANVSGGNNVDMDHNNLPADYAVFLTANGVSPVASATQAVFVSVPITAAGELVIEFVVTAGGGGPYRASFDHLDLFADEAQYIELFNISSHDPVDLTNWTLNVDDGSSIQRINVATTADPFVLQPGEYAVLTGDGTGGQSIYDSIYRNVGTANILETTGFLIASATRDFFKQNVVAGGRDVSIELRDAMDNYMDSATVHIEYTPGQRGFEAFERADPTAVEYDFVDLQGSGFPDTVVTTHPWGDLHFKDAFIADVGTARQDFNGGTAGSPEPDEGWVWNPTMKPGDPDFMMYRSETGSSNPNPVLFEWNNVRLKQDREFRVRAYGQTGLPVGLVSEVAGEVINNTTPALTTGGAYLADNPGGIAVIRPNLDTTLSLSLAPDIDAASAGASAPFFIKSVNLVTHQTLEGAYPSGRYLTGSPGADNAAYYPLRPVIEEPLVKNGRLATPGELTQISTGQTFIRDATRAAYLADYISTEPLNNAERTGLININTAPRAVLMALPWSETGVGPEFSFSSRVQIAEICSWIVWQWAHNPLGPDGMPGRAGVDDDLDGNTDMVGGIPDAGELNAVGSDDGPFDNVGELLTCLNKSVLPDGRKAMDALQQIQPQITAERIFARVSNVTTVRSSVFSVISRGRVLDMANRGDTHTRLLSQKRVRSVVYREEF